jgi:hypothetical protein
MGKSSAKTTLSAKLTLWQKQVFCASYAFSGFKKGAAMF